ncbi:methylenetetrahydrofolate reductase [NAD(P)H] [Caloramator sp. E03]|uniref:methylenetetrahydrofolate reductase [NAD(P)H] n=1 Tax=Caloramator sp. E03 TaxID=2576307 RepID=UPI0011109FE0|nr:methylenetetrahydrofolate reductase [NAD(P)H] [Caloramator sp. E03]QCX32432.1 methylenetetrahydrofolate reductase [NAD(P)H] [Caloramator sp. E03]
MLIKDIFNQKRPVISFEIFPPKKEYPISTIYETIEKLKDLNPDFISVTYGSGGGNRDRTVEIASTIKNNYGIESLAHLTCIASSRNEIQEILHHLKNNGIDNILALRGDLPKDLDSNSCMSYMYAKDLISQIVKMNGFCIGAAAYPEGHIESENLEEDVKYLKEKVDAGADFLITQLFFDNEMFYNFKDLTVKYGINVPITAGILPVLNKSQILRIITLSGASLPKKFIRILDKYEYSPKALFEAGIAYATEQIIDLLSWGVDGIHLYTMNKAEVAIKIIDNISEIKNALNQVNFA